MSRKRRNTSSPESDYTSPPPKPPRSVVSYDDEEDSDFVEPEDVKEQPRQNPDFGQSNAFPGLGVNENELFYGPAADGIDYLRMVRSEAKSVPRLLFVPKSHPRGEAIEDEADEEYEEEDGYYNDGTFIGVTTASESTSHLSAAQQHYYQAVLERFRLSRQNLRIPPSAAAIAALGESRPITLPRGSKIARDAWERHLLHCDPHPVQLASTDPDSTFELVRLISKRMGNFLKSGSEQRVSRVGSWIWALLARCPDRGELGAEEIADLRVLALIAAKHLKIEYEVEDVLDGDSKETDDEDEELSAAVREALMARVEMQGTGHKVALDNAGTLNPVSKSKAMLLDTIVTVVGEVYGQRDLLNCRTIWTEETTGVKCSSQVSLG